MRATLMAEVVALVGVFCLECGASTGLLDGCVAVADSAGMNPSTAFTLEAWIFPTSFHMLGNVDDSYQTIILKWAQRDDQRSYLLDIYQDQLELAISTTGRPQDTPGVYSNTRLTLNRWTHVAGVYDGIEFRVYIDGVKDTATAPQPVGAFHGQASVSIAGFGGTYERFHGGIDEVRISDIARYSGDFAIPKAEFSPDSHTMLLMHMNEGSGTATENFGLVGGDGTLDVSSGWGVGAPIIPEPATLALLALGGLALLGRRRVAPRTGRP